VRGRGEEGKEKRQLEKWTAGGERAAARPRALAQQQSGGRGRWKGTKMKVRDSERAHKTTEDEGRRPTSEK
jgi:hypothetical protein